MENDNKRWFIKGSTVRWVKMYITKNLEWDHGRTHLVVSMHNNLNEANRPSDVMVENVDTKDFFETKKEAQMEIIRRERFDKKR